jgi:subtilisin-like proprotein convertase family protein
VFFTLIKAQNFRNSFTQIKKLIMKKNVTQKRSQNWLLKAVLVAFITLTTIFPSFSQILINEGFNTAIPLPTGWAQQNLSTPVGTTGWFQGNPANFPAFNGSTNSYIGANFNSVSGDNTISNWLFAPAIPIKNGDQLTFYTRTIGTGPGSFPDRLQVRLSTNGASVNAGTTNTSVGDFTTLLLDINPTLNQTAYPAVWTLYTVTISGLTGPTNGRIAFRYFVTNGGSGANSDNIGIDQVTYDGTPCTNTAATAPIVSASAFSVCAGTPVTLTANGPLSNSANWKFYTGSCGGTPIAGTGSSVTVTPAVTTTYYVRGEGGCGTTPNGLCSTITINVTNCACVVPDAAIICAGTIQKLSAKELALTINSTNVPIPVPDANAAGTTSFLNATLPPGALITNMSVNFTMTHTWDGDMVINLQSPSGQVLNLINSRGGSGDNFTNTTITSVAGATPIAAGVAPFTGTFAPDAANGVGATGAPALISNVGTFAALYGTPNGAWRLTMRDVAGGDVGNLTAWSITFNYVAPAPTWSGGAIFSDANATIAYIAGTPAASVWVQPSVTTTYVATYASGACAGANNIPVTVLAKPNVTVNNASGCGPLTITASGANSYSWAPGAGLSTTIGATVTANPGATTTYNVTGLNTNGCFSTPVPVLVNASPSASVISSVAPGPTFQINEGFDALITPTPNNSTGPAGWNTKNNSSPVGITGWFQGNTAVFNSFDGAANAYIAANFNNTTPAGTISNWLFTPTVNIKNGDVISFYTRTFTGNTRPDRVQLRMSLNGSSENVGTTATSVGDFTAMLVEVNPGQLTGTTNFPDVFTQYTATITGVTGTVSGKFAFRYFLTNGGNVPGTTSNFFGIDRVQYGTPATGINCANNVNNIKVDITGGVSPYKVVYSDGTTNTIYNGYTSGASINVAPAVTTTYTIVSVTGANGCVGLGNSGAATITVTPTASITTQPANRTICVGANTTFVVVPNTTNGTTYLWEVNPGTGVWAPATGGVYSGGTTATLTITGAPVTMLGYTYRVTVNGFCGGVSTSTPATLTVVTPAGGTATLVNATTCANGSTTLTLGGTLTGGPGFTYQYQVSTDGGTTFANVTNGGIYSGATTTALTITNPPIANPKYQYRVLVNTVGACGGITSTVSTLTVNAIPVVTISAAPIVKLFPGLTSTLTGAVSNGTSPYSYLWFRNGASVATATTNSLVVGIDALGTYTLRVTDANGCVANAGTSTPGSIAISDSATSDRLFIYPSPNSGQFQVRYFTNLSDGSRVPGAINIYDEKGSRVFSSLYNVGRGYQPMRVDLGATHGKGIYRVDVIDTRGERLKTGSVMVF